MRVKHLILGAGPTGLAAAWRLNELGEKDWLLVEKSGTAGGLASSVVDEKGYTWDQGGHIQFSHYDYFDKLMDELLPADAWLKHERESWVWIQGGFVPYPFQNNLRRLPKETMWDCVKGLVDLYKSRDARPPRNFGEWAALTFGEGICRHFMTPYNFKVWAYPLEELSHGWIGERVAVTDLERVLQNILFERDDLSWGPNATFRFPLRGGTGEVWRRAALRLPQARLRLGAHAIFVNTAERRVAMARPHEPFIDYEHLITTMPLDLFIQSSDLATDPVFAQNAALLRHSSTHVIGLGVEGPTPEPLKTKCWMYFPESDTPFYRATVFSNYSPNNVPDIRKGWSLMCEVSESPAKPVGDAVSVVNETIQGALNAKLVGAREDIVHAYHRRLPYGYPTPSLRRDEAVNFLLPALGERGVHSRGRFGAWKYEVSNQDHSAMQGVEIADKLVKGEEEKTVWRPELVNAPKK